MRHIYDMCVSLEISEDKIGLKGIVGYGKYLPVLIFLEISRNNVGEIKITGQSKIVLAAC